MSKPYTVTIHMLVEYNVPVIARDEEDAERMAWGVMSNDTNTLNLDIKSSEIVNIELDGED